MKKKLILSLIQSNIFLGKIRKNIDHFSGIISKIKTTDIILLPEMFNTGFCASSHHLAEPMDGQTIAWMKKISSQKKCAIVGSLMIQENGKRYNRLVWISKNNEIYTYDKRHLFALINENKHITKGKERLIVNIEGWKICPLICYDLRFPVFSRNDVNYDILIYLANWPKKRIDVWTTLLKARAIENQCYSIGVNRIGYDGNNILFNGNSKVFDTLGDELFGTCEDVQETLKIELCLDELKFNRKQMNFLVDRDNFIIQ